jgi:hypothetical protein
MLRVPAVATAVILAVMALYWGHASIDAARKLDAIGALPSRGDYRVQLDFAPERFHQQRLQDRGRLVEVRDRTVFMRDVGADDLRAIAREYWVSAIDRWSAP